MGFCDFGNLLSKHDSFGTGPLRLNQTGKGVKMKLKEYEYVQVSHQRALSA
jgi:hypothetical protein